MKFFVTIFSLCMALITSGCHSSVKEPAFTKEQYVSDSTWINHYMLDSLTNDSIYVSLGLQLIHCEAFSHGRLVLHSYKSTGEVMPPVHQLYFHFTHDGKIQGILSKDDFFGALYKSGSTIYYHEDYK